MGRPPEDVTTRPRAVRAPYYHPTQHTYRNPDALRPSASIALLTCVHGLNRVDRGARTEAPLARTTRSWAVWGSTTPLRNVYTEAATRGGLGQEELYLTLSATLLRQPNKASSEPIYV